MSQHRNSFSTLGAVASSSGLLAGKRSQVYRSVKVFKVLIIVFPVPGLGCQLRSLFLPFAFLLTLSLIRLAVDKVGLSSRPGDKGKHVYELKKIMIIINKLINK